MGSSSERSEADHTDIRRGNEAETPRAVIADAGPPGLMPACELRLAGIDVILLDIRCVTQVESRCAALQRVPAYSRRDE